MKFKVGDTLFVKGRDIFWYRYIKEVTSNHYIVTSLNSSQIFNLSNEYAESTYTKLTPLKLVLTYNTKHDKNNKKRKGE